LPSDLARLAKRFPKNLVHENPSGGGTYVAHHAVVQKLLLTVGPFDYAITEIIRGDIPSVPPRSDGKSARARDGSPALTNVIVGALCTLVVTIDGRRVTITEVGDCEQPHNWPHDGARLKDAASDAIKRCAARFGCGLHLWASNEYFLDDALAAPEPPKLPVDTPDPTLDGTEPF
jgi:hypothetical protein